MIAVGQQIDEFQIERFLGEGTFGKVYLAYDNLKDRPTVIKELKADFINNNEVVLRFQQEINILKSLRHPNIVSYYGSRKWDNSYYLLTEYVAGGNLRDFLSLNRAISFEELLEISKQICDAVLAIRKLGTIHRDLKPENILITPQSEVKITDFGLSYLPAFLGGFEFNEKDRALGTPMYMSQKQLLGQYDPDADIFALGAIFYELFTKELYVNKLLEKNGYSLSNTQSFHDLRNKILASSKLPFPMQSTLFRIPDWLNETISAAIDQRIQVRALLECISKKKWLNRDFLIDFEKLSFIPRIGPAFQTNDFFRRNGINDAMDLMVWKKANFSKDLFIYLAAETENSYSYLTKDHLPELSISLTDAWQNAYDNVRKNFRQQIPKVIFESENKPVAVIFNQLYGNSSSFILLPEAISFFCQYLDVSNCVIAIPNVDMIIATLDRFDLLQELRGIVPRQFYLHDHPVSSMSFLAKNGGIKEYLKLGE
ncbi:MAG: serine/threonine-protein kinase [Anaerolineaceae bacterium]